MHNNPEGTYRNELGKLTPEERLQLALLEIKKYHSLISSGAIGVEQELFWTRQINELGEKIEKTYKIAPYKFILWHKLIGSTLSEEQIKKMPHDTPNHDIENFVLQDLLVDN